ncbi:sugar transferase [Photobacterium kishitanii]|uniref:sugar transferase n=1 Tax=Photobacterium kishitanii TaxID=318456 RepID=UPI000D158504|nr:sugar transferase [Photobacterium kishitanii]PSV18352.1 lipid carrier--UDP-N-acetylgalactosaminyltransferase [Photobacterium kishitanii]
MHKFKLYRYFDITLSVIGLLVGGPILLVIFIIGFFDSRKPIFLQKRVGLYGQEFTLIKFRTMSIGTKSVATHMVDASSVTKFGAILRKTKLDELPQLINVLCGDMSFVGPRPCLFNQRELINERDKRGVFNVLPGITGLAQVSNIDMSDPVLLAKIDQEMINNLSVYFYFKYIIQTALGNGAGDKVNKI